MLGSVSKRNSKNRKVLFELISIKKLLLFIAQFSQKNEI